MDASELVRNPDELACQSHGCYNRSIMRHVRPEHDPERWHEENAPEANEDDWQPFPPKASFKMKATFVIRGRGKLNAEWLND